MLQDIAPHKLDNQYKPQEIPSDEDFVLMVDGAEVLANTEEGVRYPAVREVKASLGENINLTYLFNVDSEKFFLLQTRMDKEDIETSINNHVDINEEGTKYQYHWYNLRMLREAEPVPKYRVFAAYTAKHLADWYRDNQFCGRCGEKMTHSETERAKVCPECGYTAYPRIMPAVIVGVKNGDRLLLTRYRQGYNHNALIAGFTEIGETLEETVAREVMEEAGILVKNITYYKSQPWGIANDILVGYFCDVDGDDQIHMDTEELKFAEWVKREDIVLQPDSSSLTNEMMNQFKEGKQ